MNAYIKANWPAPLSIQAVTTTRLGGNSHPPFDSFNLALHVDDNLQDVAKNRQQLIEDLNLAAPPRWIQQIHSTEIMVAENVTPTTKADAAYTQKPYEVCVILTADCLPILLCDNQGRQVAAIHAGWRGLAQGIIAKTLAMFKMPCSEILAWLGPAISQPYYEVGAEVRQAFILSSRQASSAFTLNNQGRWQACLYTLAKQQLHRLGVEQIYGGEYCTYRDSDLFYSFRRDHSTGRMASLIWINPC